MERTWVNGIKVPCKSKPNSKVTDDLLVPLSFQDCWTDPWPELDPGPVVLWPTHFKKKSPGHRKNVLFISFHGLVCASLPLQPRTGGSHSSLEVYHRPMSHIKHPEISGKPPISQTKMVCRFRIQLRNSCSLPFLDFSKKGLCKPWRILKHQQRRASNCCGFHHEISWVHFAGWMKQQASSVQMKAEVMLCWSHSMFISSTCGFSRHANASEAFVNVFFLIDLLRPWVLVLDFLIGNEGQSLQALPSGNLT